MSTIVGDIFLNFDAKLSLNNPVGDYTKLMDDKMKADVVLPNGVFIKCWSKIAAATRETIWKLLFDESKSSEKDQLSKAAELLKMHKEDAGFYDPSEYNKWIVTVRDELLRREMFDFWKNEIVAKELGPCWARDSDLFEDTDDPEPANFYKYAGCEAVWLNKKSKGAIQSTSEYTSPFVLITETPLKSLKKISMETPLEDYEYNVEAHTENNPNNVEDGIKEIFKEVRELVWKLLFDEETLSPENYKKAAALLDAYKRDACFYSPWEYNDWIPTVRDELLKRKCFNFWKDVIVKKKLGFCCALDSDYFDNMDDPKVEEFYKVGDDYIKQQK